MRVGGWESDRPRQLKRGKTHSLAASAVIGVKHSGASPPSSRRQELGRLAGRSGRRPCPLFPSSVLETPQGRSSQTRQEPALRAGGGAEPGWGPEKDEGGEPVSLSPLLAARRRENHLWHSGDSFVTLTVMLLCAGLTHRMNP